MANLTQKIETKRELNFLQVEQFNEMKADYDALIAKFKQYEGDPFIQVYYDDVKALWDEMISEKDAWLETPLVEYKTYNIDEDDIQAVLTAIQNFKKLVALQ